MRKRKYQKQLKNYLFDKNVIDFISDAWKEVAEILNRKKNDKYFYAILLCFTLIEDTLRLTVFTQLAMEIVPTGEKSDVIGKREYFYYQDYFMKYFRETDFYNLIRWALALKIIDSKLFKELDKTRDERNNLVHKLYLEKKRKNNVYLRKKLEFYGRICDRILEIFGEMYPLKEFYDFRIITPLFLK